MSRKEVQILLVEDDVVEQKALQRALKKRGLQTPVRIAQDGLEALEILRGAQPPALPKPYLILLDLNMPRMGGLEFLRELRQDPAHRHAIVFVLTTSAEEVDRAQAYDLHVAGYIVKSDAQCSLSQVIDLLENFSEVVEFPG